MKVVESPLEKKPKLKSHSVSSNLFRNPLIAGLLAFVCFIAICAMSKVYPVGSESILMSDLEAQYAPFLFLYKRLLTNANSLQDLWYSFSLGGGKNMMSTFGYYLLSPLNFIVLLFDYHQVSALIFTLIAIKLTLSASFMALYMTKRQEDKTSYIGALLGIFYAFSSYAVVYMFNIMWLDGFMLLPLLLFFIELYIESGKKAGIIVSLFYLFISNYYIAYMVGIYSFFHLIVRMYMNGEFSSVKTGLKKVVKFVLMAVLCAMSVAAILIPVGIDTLKNGDPTKSELLEKQIQFTFIEGINQIFGGTNGEFSEVMIANPPLIFISIFVVLAFAMFFVSKVFDKKIKVVYGIVLALIYLSLSITFIDKAWQVFDSPNWFYHRQSFVFFPFFLIVALKVYEKRKEILNIEILKSSGIILALLFVAQSFGNLKESDNVFIARFLYILVITGIFILFKVTKWHKQLVNMPKILPFIFALLLVVEVVFFETILSAGVSALSVHYGSNEKYAEGIIGMEELALNIDVNPANFRAEHEVSSVDYDTAQHADAYYSGVHGISLFNSNSNKAYHRFLRQLGYICNYNYFSIKYSFAAEDTDAFLSIGSVMTGRDYAGAERVAENSNGLALYRNEEVLPLAFSVNYSAAPFDFYQLETDEGDKNYFDFRSAWYSSMFPDAYTEAFYYAPSNEVTMQVLNGSEINLSDYVASNEDEEIDSVYEAEEEDFDSIGLEPAGEVSYARTIYRTNSKLPIIINYDIVIESSDEFYINVTAPNRLSDCSIYVNGEYIDSVSSNSFFSCVSRIGSFEEGETVRVSLICDNNQFTYQSVNFAYLDHDMFASQFASIDNHVVVNEVSNGHVVITSDLADEEVVLTTIPFEDGWVMTIDGNEVDVPIYQEALIAAVPGTGHHVIELNFTPPGIKIGAIVSVLGILGLAAFCVIDKKNFREAKNK